MSSPPDPPQLRTCLRCGVPARDDAERCPACGGPLPQPVGTPPDQRASERPPAEAVPSSAPSSEPAASESEAAASERTDALTARESDLKTCPECAEQVKGAARKCRFCGYRFEHDPESVSDAPAASPAPSSVAPQSPSRRSKPLKMFVIAAIALLLFGVGIAVAVVLSSGGEPEDQLSEDLSAKSDARNLVSHVESCFADNPPGGYASCDSPEELQNTGLSLGSGEGQVEVSSAFKDSYTVTAHSKSGTDFSIEKTNPDPVLDDPNASSTIKRTCSNPGAAGCPAGGEW